MDINGTNIGASTYAMKKALENPNLMLNLVQKIANSENPSLNTKNSVVKQIPDLAATTGKGKIIDIIE
jgi:hypothetical protein